MLKFTNNASATLAGAITSAATSIVLSAGNGSLFPALGAGEFCYGTLVDSSNNLEVVKITARTSDTLTVVRAQDNTVARAYSVGDKFELRLVAAVFQELIQRDGSIAMTASLNHGGFKAVGLADPTVATDAATKNYVDVNISSAVSAESARATAAEATKAPLTGAGASGTWPISVSGAATAIANSGGWSVTPSGGKLYFSYAGVNKMSLDSSGNVIAIGNVTGFTAP